MGWITTWEPILESTQAVAGERNYRNVLPANIPIHNGSKIRITVTAGATGALVIDGTSIGIMTANDDMDDPANGTFKRVTWVDAGGGNGIVAPAIQSKVSDGIIFDFDKTKRHGIHFYMASRANSRYTNTTGIGFYYKTTGDETLTQLVAYTYNVFYTYVITKLEVYVALVPIIFDVASRIRIPEVEARKRIHNVSPRGRIFDREET